MPFRRPWPITVSANLAMFRFQINNDSRILSPDPIAIFHTHELDAWIVCKVYV